MADKAVRHPGDSEGLSQKWHDNSDGTFSEVVHIGSTSVAGGGGDGAILDGVSASTKATVKALSNSNPLVVLEVDGTGTAIPPPSQTLTANLNSNTSFSVAVAGYGGVGAQALGAFNATLNFEASIDGGVNWFAITGANDASDVAVNTILFDSTNTGGGPWRFNVSGFTHFRVRVSAYVSGTIALTLAISPEPPRNVKAQVSNAGNFLVQDSQVITDNAAFTDTGTKLFSAGFVFDEVAGTALTENDAAAARIDSKRAQIAVLEDATTRGQRATVTAANALKVDASGVAVPITDNSGSLTVDAPVGTPVFVRLSDGAASLIGQKVMASSLPVVFASDQSALDVSDRATRETGRVRIWDGTDEATVLPIRTAPATTEKALQVMETPSRLQTYEGIATEFAPAITVGVKPGFTLWHPNTATVDVYILEVRASIVVTTAGTAGQTALQLQFISADGATGTTGTQALDSGGAASACTYRGNPGTDGTASGNAFRQIQAMWATQTVGRVDIPVFTATTLNDAIILRGGASVGLRGNENQLVAGTALVYRIAWAVRWIEL